MNNRFAFSFGSSLFIVGVFAIFFDINEIILLGLSISTFLFSIVNMITYYFKNEKLEFLYIIPLFFIIIIFCFDESIIRFPIILYLLNTRFNNALTFFSFGLLFITEFLKNIKAKNEIIDNENKKIKKEIENDIEIIKSINDNIKKVEKSKISQDTKNILIDIMNIIARRTRINYMKQKMISKNDKFNIDDLEEVYNESYRKFNYNIEHNKME